MFSRRQILLGALLVTASRVAAEDPWAAFRDGRAIALMRHATAPGTGDPEGFELGDCSTQRNLSDEGRAQARRIGASIAAKGIGTARVHTSQWCRCRDTATLLGLGPVTEQPLLNSFFGTLEDGGRQTEDLRRWMAALPPGKPVLLVTHQVNITALTDIFPASGELVFVGMGADGNVKVLGRAKPE